MTWPQLCGLAVQLCGGQSGFQPQARILARLVKQFGAQDVERMIRGAMALGWRDLKSIGSKDGLGRRWSLERYWQDQKKTPVETLESVAQTLKARGF